jgi:hypothetical protein
MLIVKASYNVKTSILYKDLINLKTVIHYPMMMIMIFWVLRSCRLIGRNQCFFTTLIYQQVCTVSKPRKTSSSLSDAISYGKELYSRLSYATVKIKQQHHINI